MTTAFTPRPGTLDQRTRVFQRAESEDAVLVQSVDPRHPGGAARGEEKGVVRRDAAVTARDGLRIGINVNDANADTQIDMVALIPLDGVQDDVVGGLLAGEHRRQHDAVVVDVRFIAEDSDLELWRVLQDLFEAGHPGHAVADDDEARHRAATVLSTLTADCL
jgi:hypothetical protein